MRKSKLKSHIIQNQTELKAYQALMAQKLKIEFPLEYFERGQVHVFKDEKGIIRGGYALIKEGPLRSLTSANIDLSKHNIKESEVMEVNAVWLDRKLGSRLSSCKFWMTFITEMARTRDKKYFVYTYDLKNIKLRNLYSFTKPTVLHRGPTKILAGMKTSEPESIELASCRRMNYLLLLAAPNFISKALFKQARLRDVPVQLFNKISLAK